MGASQLEKCHGEDTVLSAQVLPSPHLEATLTVQLTLRWPLQKGLGSRLWSEGPE